MRSKLKEFEQGHHLSNPLLRSTSGKRQRSRPVSVDRWRARLGHVLDRLSAICDDSSRDDQWTACEGFLSHQWLHASRSLLRESPGLTRLVEAFSWIQVTRADREDTSILIWIREHSDSLLQIESGPAALQRQVALGLMREDIGPVAMTFYLRALADGYQIDEIVQRNQECEKLAQELHRRTKLNSDDHWRPIKSPELKETMKAHVDWLANQSSSKRKDAAELLSSVLEERFAADLAEMRTTLGERHRDLQRHLNRCKYMGSSAYFVSVDSETIQSLVSMPNSTRRLAKSIPYLRGMIKRIQIDSEDRSKCKIFSSFLKRTHELPWRIRVRLYVTWANFSGDRYRNTLPSIRPLLSKTATRKAMSNAWIRWIDDRCCKEPVMFYSRWKLTSDDWKKLRPLLAESIKDNGSLGHASSYYQRLPNMLLLR